MITHALLNICVFKKKHLMWMLFLCWTLCLYNINPCLVSYNFSLMQL